METKFTKGEWKIARKTERRAIFENPDIDVWAIGGRSIEETMANAKLIAAAPEMLTALIEISKGQGRYNMDRLRHAANTIEDMIGLANMAIKKATE